MLIKEVGLDMIWFYYYIFHTNICIPRYNFPRNLIFISPTTPQSMMLTSPNSWGSQDDGLTLGQLSKEMQIMEETLITIGFTNALLTELTNLGSDTQQSYQMVKSPECSTQMERFGTKNRLSHGIPLKENYKAPSHQDQECVEAR